MADVINKTTKQILYSVNSPDFDSNDWIIMNRDRDNSDYDDLISNGIPQKYWKIASDRLEEMNQSEKDTVDLSELPAYKQAKIASIDKKTEHILHDIGFEFPPGSGKRIGLTPENNPKILGMLISKDSPGFPYPIRFNTIDQTTLVLISNATEVMQFYGTALLTTAAIEESGTTLKVSVREATTKAEVDAVVDSR